MIKINNTIHDLNTKFNIRLLEWCSTGGWINGKYISETDIQKELSELMRLCKLTHRLGK